MVDDADGLAAVSLARSAVDLAVRAPPIGIDPAAQARFASLPPLFSEPRGAFVTLERWPGRELRGCIGYPLPVHPLRIGIPRLAAAAALEDPRFPPVEPEELDRIVVEVSLLTVPEPLRGATAEERLARVEVGRDGLIVERGAASGLLLPQVAPEQGWNALGLLEGTCQKAGLDRDAWRSPTTRIHRFEAEIFSEPKPRGTAQRRRPDRGAPRPD